MKYEVYTRLIYSRIVVCNGPCLFTFDHALALDKTQSNCDNTHPHFEKCKGLASRAMESVQ